MKLVNVHDAIRAHLLSSVKLPAYEVLARVQWCPEFETFMRNRLIQGAFRYGTIPDNLALGKRFNCVASIAKRLALYEQTNNLEHLVDIANLALCEFIQAKEDGAIMESTDDGEHTDCK